MTELDFSVFQAVNVNGPSRVIICASEEQAERVAQREVYIVFYVSPKEFAAFSHEAEQIFNEYSIRETCFRMIPDIWFDDAMLVRFLRERLKSHSAMKPWFNLDPTLPGSTGMHWSRRLEH